MDLAAAGGETDIRPAIKEQGADSCSSGAMALVPMPSIRQLNFEG